MAVLRIQVPTDVTWSQQTTTLQNTPYQLEFRYNERDTLWRLSFYDAAGNPILMGMPLRCGVGLTLQYPQLALPQGLFVVDDTTGQHTDPSLSSFATTHRLYFFDFTDA